MPTLPFLTALVQLNLENWFDRATVRGIARVGHVPCGFAEANQLVVRPSLDSPAKIFYGPTSLADHFSIF
jgi:hypothetical protein